MLFLGLVHLNVIDITNILRKKRRQKRYKATGSRVARRLARNDRAQREGTIASSAKVLSRPARRLLVVSSKAAASSGLRWGIFRYGAGLKSGPLSPTLAMPGLFGPLIP